MKVRHYSRGDTVTSINMIQWDVLNKDVLLTDLANLKLDPNDPITTESVGTP
jgi:hypothetical protein